MDPDGLSIGTMMVSAAICFLCSFGTGASCADETDKNRRSVLGFSDRVAGLVLGCVFGCAFFVLGTLQLCRPKPPLTLLWVLLLVLLALLCAALGFAKKAVTRAFLPFEWVGAVVTAPAKLVFRAANLTGLSTVTEKELLELVDDVEEQDLIDETQKEMITNIVELDEVTAGDIMTHRTELITLPETATVSEAVAAVQEHGYSRMPITRKNIDDIAGILYAKDLFSVWHGAADTRCVSEFMRGAMFVPEACRASDLLVEFKLKRTQVAIVVDEYGGTAGLVSMEDILEEIVGNIQDEFDDEEEDVVQTSEGIIALGSADLEDVFKALALPMPDEDENDEADFDSVSGLLIDKLGRLPAPGEAASITYGGAVFTVLKAAERRIEKVRCTKEIFETGTQAEPEEA